MHLCNDNVFCALYCLRLADRRVTAARGPGRGSKWARECTAIYNLRCWTPCPPSYSSSSTRTSYMRGLLLQYFATTEWCRGRKVWEKALACPIIDTPSGGVSWEGGREQPQPEGSEAYSGGATQAGSSVWGEERAVRAVSSAILHLFCLALVFFSKRYRSSGHTHTQTILAQDILAQARAATGGASRAGGGSPPCSFGA